ncbi:MAG TPA: hypothetical protein VHM90_11575 [Phycisphaerae bacterium]|jgi:hypothetical protein|nr:hypothetical protein [Phycisphaerae bacterium]
MSDNLAVDPLAALVGEIVIFDTQGPLIYIGKLERVTEHSLLLTGADVHDTNDSRATKDLYLVETRDLGIRVNRTIVVVMRAQIASVSLLRDVVD